MKKLIFLSLLVVFISFSKNSFAYTTIFGYEVPTRLSEVKSKISMFVAKKVQNCCGDNAFVQSAFGPMIAESQSPQSTSSNFVQDLDNESITNLATPQNVQAVKALIVDNKITFTEQQLNSIINSKIKDINVRDVTIQAAQVDLVQNGLIADISIQNGIAISATFVLNSDKKSFKAEEVKSIGSVNIPTIQLLLIKTTINNASNVIPEMLGAPAEAIQSIEITDNELVVNVDSTKL